MMMFRIAALLLLMAGPAQAACVSLADCQAAAQAAHARIDAFRPSQDQWQSTYRSANAKAASLPWGDPARHQAQAQADEAMRQIKILARERKGMDKAAVSADRDLAAMQRQSGAH